MEVHVEVCKEEQSSTAIQTLSAMADAPMTVTSTLAWNTNLLLVLSVEKQAGERLIA